MNTIRVSATAARNRFFELLDEVSKGVEIIIEKDKKEVAVMSRKTQYTNIKELLKASRAARGVLKDYDPEDNPLRRKGASDFLGKWDKGMKWK